MLKLIILSSLMSCGGTYEDRSLNSTANIVFSEDTLLMTRRDSTIYSIGYILKPNTAAIEGLNKKEQEIFDLAAKHAAEDLTPLIAKETMNLLVDENNQNALKEKQDMVTNKLVNDKFFEENAKKEGVKTLRSGLQYKIIESGKGKSPILSDSVSINYICMLITGEKDPISVAQNYEFKLDEGIEGWKEALQLMKPGDKWVVYVPYNLAYGAQSAANGKIKPYSPLIFRMELNSIINK